MSGSRFAPGPWRYDPEHEAITAGARGLIARAEPASGPLMATAPELYDALTELMHWETVASDAWMDDEPEWSKDEIDEMRRKAWSAARAALAKARGES